MNTLQQILQGVDTTTGKSFDIPVQSVCSDSRHILPGSAFVAIPGSQLNGSDFITDAIHKGATAIISNEKLGKLKTLIHTPLITVKNPRQALSRISANFYKHPSEQLTVIGITGTNGKTTTSYLLYSILQAFNLKTGLIGTLGAKADGMEAKTPLTTPDSIDLHRMLKLFVEGGVTHVIIEVSSHALSQDRVSDVSFDMGIFTNLTQDHLDYHKTMEEYFKAKTKLFTMLPPTGKAILNANDKYFHHLKKITGSSTVSFNIAGKGDITFLSWGMSKDGISGIIQTEKGDININSRLIGIHNLENIITAVSAANALGIPDSTIERGIKNCINIPGRMERFTTKNGASIFIDYAHTPDAYHKLFSSIKMLLPEMGRLSVIFGCGGDRDPDKRPLMAAAVEEYAHEILVTPDNPRSESLKKINNDILSGFSKTKHTIYSNRGGAVRYAISKLQPEDILVIVGKGRENYQIIGTEKIYYSDVENIEKSIYEN